MAEFNPMWASKKQNIYQKVKSRIKEYSFKNPLKFPYQEFDNILYLHLN